MRNCIQNHSSYFALLAVDARLVELLAELELLLVRARQACGLDMYLVSVQRPFLGGRRSCR